jgi:hypothetical protein
MLDISTANLTQCGTTRGRVPAATHESNFIQGTKNWREMYARGPPEPSPSSLPIPPSAAMARSHIARYTNIEHSTHMLRDVSLREPSIGSLDSRTLPPGSLPRTFRVIMGDIQATGNIVPWLYLHPWCPILQNYEMDNEGRFSFHSRLFITPIMNWAS